MAKGEKCCGETPLQCLPSEVFDQEGTEGSLCCASPEEEKGLQVYAVPDQIFSLEEFEEAHAREAWTTRVAVQHM